MSMLRPHALRALVLGAPSKLTQVELGCAVLDFQRPSTTQCHHASPPAMAACPKPYYAGAAAVAARKSARVAALEAASSGAGCGARPRGQGAPGPSQTLADGVAGPSQGTPAAPLPPAQEDSPAQGSPDRLGLSGGAACPAVAGRAAAEGASGGAEGGDAGGCAEQAAAAAEAVALLLARKVWMCVAAVCDAGLPAFALVCQECRAKKQHPTDQLDSRLSQAVKTCRSSSRLWRGLPACVALATGTNFKP